MFVGGFLLGMWHEGTSSIILAGLIIYLFVLKLIYKKSLPLWFYLGIIGLFIGFCILFFSPGQNSRIISESAKYDYIGLKDFLSLGIFGWIERLNVVLKNALNQNPIFFPVFAFVVAFIYSFWQQIKNKIFSFLILFFSLLLFLLILLELPSIAYFVLLVMFFYIYKKIKDVRFLFCFILLSFYLLSILSTFQLLHLPFRSRALGVILLIIIILILMQDYLKKQKIQFSVFIFSLLYFGYVYYCYYDLNTKWNNLVSFVNNAKDNFNGQQELLHGKVMNTYDVEYMGYKIDLVVPKEQYSFSYKGFSAWWKLSDDIYNDINQSYSFIFKIKSIRLE